MIVRLTALSADPWDSVLAFPIRSLIPSREIRPHAHREVAVGHLLIEVQGGCDCEARQDGEDDQGQLGSDEGHGVVC